MYVNGVKQSNTSTIVNYPSIKGERMKKKVIIGVVTIVVIAIIATLGIHQNQKIEDKDVIKIGAILPLTGPISLYGKSSQQGLQLAVEKIQNLELKRKIIINYEDNRSEAKSTVAAYRKLKNEKIQCLFSISSVAINTILAINPNEFLMMTSVSENNATHGRNRAFRLNPTAMYDAAVFADFIKNQQIKNIAILYADNDYGIELNDAIRTMLANSKIKIIASEKIDSSEVDVLPTLHKIIATKPEAIYLATFAKQSVLLARKLMELKFNKDKFSGFSFYNDYIIKACGVAAENFLVPVSSFEPNHPITPVQREFVKEYKERFGELPDVTAAQMFDLASLFFNILSNSNGDVEASIELMKKTKNHKGVLGSISCDHNRNFLFPITIKKIVNGRATSL